LRRDDDSGFGMPNIQFECPTDQVDRVRQRGRPRYLSIGQDSC
jgi:hypothetical protein